jgi:hypothetical protein
MQPPLLSLCEIAAVAILFTFLHSAGYTDPTDLFLREICTMGSQNVTRIVALHCNGRTNGNTHLTIQIRTLARTHTCSIYLVTVGSSCERLLLKS